MTIILGCMCAAVGLLIGWTAGSAVVVRRAQRRREHKSRHDYEDLCRVLAHTARSNKGER